MSEDLKTCLEALRSCTAGDEEAKKSVEDKLRSSLRKPVFADNLFAVFLQMRVAVGRHFWFNCSRKSSGLAVAVARRDAPLAEKIVETAMDIQGWDFLCADHVLWLSASSSGGAGGTEDSSSPGAKRRKIVEGGTTKEGGAMVHHGTREKTTDNRLFMARSIAISVLQKEIISGRRTEMITAALEIFPAEVIDLPAWKISRGHCFDNKKYSFQYLLGRTGSADHHPTEILQMFTHFPHMSHTCTIIAAYPDWDALYHTQTIGET